MRALRDGRLRVAHVAPVITTIPPGGHGSIERVIEELHAFQLRDGRVESVVYASSDSTLTRGLRGRVPSLRSMDERPPEELVRRLEREHYRWACADAQDVDVLHAHGVWVLDHCAGATAPIVLSVYTDTSRPEVQAELAGAGGRVHLVANSASTRSKFPAAPWFATVLEGVAPERYPFRAAKEDFFVFLGDLRPKKGCHIAIRVARELGAALKIIGRRRIAEVPERARAYDAYFEEQVAPYLGRDIEYLGELGEQRLGYLAAARALLAPICWDEPFGRVFAEALACGTPVVTFRRGAAGEVVAPGTGFVVDTVEQMVRAAARVDTISPAACLRHALGRLNVSRVAAQYLDIYERVVGGRTRRPDAGKRGGEA
jgi:glycosyltransferase involved in cell wall biosynthesis